MMRVFVEGVGVLGPGLQGWPSSRAVLADQESYRHVPVVVPASSMLPPIERRRVGTPVKLALAVGQEAFAQAGCDVAATATVFASSSGDGDNLHQICDVLASADRLVSPTRFHNSVHNAAAGYWSIATGSREASVSLACYDTSFAAGLLEAAGQVIAAHAAVALIAYDHPYPQPLHAVRSIAADFAVALVLTPAPTTRAFASLEIEFLPCTGETTTMRNSDLEVLRLGVPAARSLPILGALAAVRKTKVVLEYAGDAQLIVMVSAIAGASSGSIA
jgi:hypothetical protein